ncbi:ADP-ribosylation factor-like protein 11 [Kryptolebias marmoratus]|uniref:ADP-ribosylation factor-like protein 11 n=1 Tax=Kryptolebias marmoratus TaxID=37003 RepID=A0A3Q2ZFY2_KRYMA|nr:ADP-ribosylation factor-like protein 11 [Kryptolebias marmoratus]
MTCSTVLIGCSPEGADTPERFSHLAGWFWFHQTEEEMGQSSSTYPQVILVGLDSAGKSTLLAKLLTGKVMETSPTVGFNVGTLDLDKKTSLTVWDVGGQKSMRVNWKYYLDDCKALVFVVDSSDQTRMPEAQKALEKILRDERLEGVPLMVLANKKDLPNSMTIREVSTQLNLPSYKDRRWEIQACSAVQGLGLQQAFLSINKMIKRS